MSGILSGDAAQCSGSFGCRISGLSLSVSPEECSNALAAMDS